jgi:hypothetical protein
MNTGLTFRRAGALVLRSDEILKAICGVRPLERLGPEGYAHVTCQCDEVQELT